MAPPDPSAAKLTEPSRSLNGIVVSPIPEVVAAAPSDDDDSSAPKIALRRTEFGVDVGTANSVNGLRALWRGLLKSRSNAPLATLQPDHRRQGRHQRARHAAQAGGRSLERRRRRRKDLRGADRKQAALARPRSTTASGCRSGLRIRHRPRRPASHRRSGARLPSAPRRLPPLPSSRSRPSRKIRPRSRLSSTGGLRNNLLKCNVLRDSLDTSRGTVSARYLSPRPIPIIQAR